jgi:RNA polymerase sigma factor (sigma-70 family)
MEFILRGPSYVMSTPPKSFNELLQLARAGDQAALEQLAKTYEQDLRIAARVHLGPALRPYLDSIDLVQSIHRSLLLGLQDGKFDVSTPASLIALTITMLRRKISRHWRKHRRQQRLTNTNDSSDSVDVLLSISARSANPAAVASTRDLLNRIWSELDDVDRQFLELRLQGYSTADAAEQMGKTAEALRVRLHRLRNRLAEAGVAEDCL